MPTTLSIKPGTHPVDTGAALNRVHIRHVTRPVADKCPFSFDETHIIDPMAPVTKSRIGRPSKGQRHSFTVKLDMERTAKLFELLEILDTNGIDYMAPIIEAHLDAIDLEQLRTQGALPIAEAS